MGKYLADKSLPDLGIVIGAEGLLEKGKQNRHDDADFEAFAEADEEDCDGN